VRSTLPPEAPQGVTYLLPIRCADGPAPVALTDYLRWVSGWSELVIVDGSPPEVFDAHDRAWRAFSVHRPPDPDLACRNGKVRGVLTGLRLASCNKVIIADDDVRYDLSTAKRVIELLDVADVVQPQNYFHPLPWHARWDTARSLVNRAIGADWPGTLGVRRCTLDRAGGYDGDVLFENLELVRTVRAHGGRIRIASDCYVCRRPPTARHFWSQRTRQAYDEFARPLRLAVALAILPGVVWLRRRPAALAPLAATPVALAAIGRRRHGGSAVFPRSAVVLAPVWMAERAVCAWIAVWWRMRGGCPYAGSRLVRAAHSERELRRRRRRGDATSMCPPTRCVPGSTASTHVPFWSLLEKRRRRGHRRA
jgi:hypothetical protein